jgi:chromate transporter
VQQRRWITEDDFEDGIAAVNLLPGPASTQLAIFCAWRLRGTLGALTGGIAFILPGLLLIIGLSTAFLASHPPQWILGAAAGAGAVVPAIACQASFGLIPASWKRMGKGRADHFRWFTYFFIGAGTAIRFGPYLVIGLLMVGGLEVLLDARPDGGSKLSGFIPIVGIIPIATGGIGALIWVAIKVGALSYGGGFVIVPLMQHDAVTTHHWLTTSQFLGAVALGQVTPGPVVLTVAVIGFAASRVLGALIATIVAFAPSFMFVIIGGRSFDTIRSNAAIQSFLSGAGTAVIGAIFGSAFVLGSGILHAWQFVLLGLAVLWLVALRKGVVSAILAAALIGVAATALGAPL